MKLISLSFVLFLMLLVTSCASKQIEQQRVPTEREVLTEKAWLKSGLKPSYLEKLTIEELKDLTN